MKPLDGKIALVTGGSRGAGRGIALELGKAGAIVYVTGRSSGERSTNQWPGTIDETVTQIEEMGGKGIAVRCDHTIDLETKSLIHQIRKEQGKLDILVNNVWGGHDLWSDANAKPFCEFSLKQWDTMFTAGVRAQLATNYFAIPLLREQEKGLIVHTTFWDQNKYTGTFYYDLAKNAITRMAYGLSIELKDDHIPVIAVSPGWMRTELVLLNFQTDEQHWQEVESLQSTESPYYVGRAITYLAQDPNNMNKTGQVLKVGDLAKEYGFTDIDGRYVPPFYI